MLRSLQDEHYSIIRHNVRTCCEGKACDPAENPVAVEAVQL